jgi:hypothetical protein
MTPHPDSCPDRLSGLPTLTRGDSLSPDSNPDKVSGYGAENPGLTSRPATAPVPPAQRAHSRDTGRTESRSL